MLILIPTAALALPSLQVDYYGTVSSSSDTNMIKMAQDLFYQQLTAIENVTVTDHRSSSPHTSVSDLSFAGTPSGHIVLYAEISDEQNSDSPAASWNCTLHALNPENDANASETGVYDSYYKILISAKSSIERVLEKIAGKDTSQSSSASKPPEESAVSTEQLAGIWSGESDIDKTVILRGGRGFVIFKNGASMTITVSVEHSSDGQIILIKQTGKPNASYYPSLPRESALAAASTAKPIEWTLKASGNGILTGTKKTLVPSSDNGTAVEGIETVVWKKK